MSGTTHAENDVETKTMEDPPNDSCKSEAKLMNQTDAALLDDEEMPTYISMSSTSRPDDSDVTSAKRPEDLSQEVDEDRSRSPSDDQGASSVYVLSSGEDTDQHPYEDDEDEYGDSDDMENLELDNEFDPEHPNNMKHLMDEDDDDEDDEDEEEEEEEEAPRQMHDVDDDDIDNDDNKVDYVDIRSDDYILNRRLKNHDKSKSLSLQDLNEYTVVNYNAAVQYSKRRRSHILRRNYMNIPQNAVMYSVLNKKPPPKYHHVQSKVKLYIKSIKEQNRRSMERNMKHQENGLHDNMDNVGRSNSDHKNSETKGAKPAMANKTIKDYAERTIKELEIAEACDKDRATYNVAPIMLNGQDSKNVLESIHEEATQHEIRISVPFAPAQNKDTANVADSMKTDRAIGQGRAQAEMYAAEPMDVSDADNNDTCTLRIENIKSIGTMDDETKSNEHAVSDRATEEFNKTSCDAFEVAALREQLSKKTVQYNDLLDAYQKQLTENFRMKEELDELRKSLAKYEPREQKVAAIQTDVVEPAPDERNDQEAKPDTDAKQSNKILGNSVASTLSSIGEWSDSACNLSISMKPPEAVKTLHSDDSMLLTDGTPGKTARPLSRAFLTSSRILQTLASITQGKAKPESPLVQSSKKRLNEENASTEIDDGSYYQSQPSSSKKRKIADILGPSSFLQSLKASQVTAGSLQSRLNESSNVESKFKFDSVNDSVSGKVESQEDGVKAGHSETAENKTENADDAEDNMKCFVYHEDENSKNRSFLILAEETEKDKTVSGKGRIRECGPYLLGNVEVRMSEINGTINIWGKEISQESTAETENEMDTSKTKTDKKHHSWQKSTPHTRFNGSNLVCSTGKKLKTPSRFELSSVASNLSCPRTSSSSNIARPSCSTDRTPMEDLLYGSRACVSSCEACDSTRHSKEWLKHRRVQEKLHSCCTRNVDVEQKCNCFLHKEKQKFEDNCNCNSKERSSTKKHRSFSRHFECNRHLHESVANPAAEDSEPACRCHTTCHSPHDPGEGCQDSHRCKREDYTCEPLASTDREVAESCSHHSSNVHEEEPLITQKHYSETPEARRRRLSGRRVRGILMDFLRGCGDCYSPNASSNSKGCVHKKNSCLTTCGPQIKITPCASPEPTCSNPGQSVGRCCHAYAQRIESQLEEFRVEMERVRSRSDAILNMLNMLHSVDMN
ncbi:hypothetical protein DMN91_012314 [Ooceraea biroi]|uniref:Uncharacterized protein n=2 Tax=Ooceraea biroi TaxID=2015173 RepID=A0A026VV48_OOCBI|nr:hypothetical protein X777_02635 [Ooceraea biroi]RLU15320.1 hypothetical protein DMN91_012314 [Ooceraea biroi]